MIRLVGVSKSFGETRILDDVSLDFPIGETTAIIGPSGVGKSVTLKLLVGLIRADAGLVEVFGTDMGSAPERELYAVRRRIGMLFQDGALFDSMSVGENIAFPLLHHAPEVGPGERRTRVEETLALVGLPGFHERWPSELSGGQRKRVGLARAIIMRPEVVLFDEPTSGLDPLTSEAIDDLILEMKERLGVTFIIISHDIIGTLRVADHIAMLYGGQIVAQAPTSTFLQSPEPLVRRFLRRNIAFPDELVERDVPPYLRSIG